MSIKRQSLIDALVARLKTIQTSNGFYTNLGLNVYDYRVTPFEANELPAINIKDDDETKYADLAGNPQPIDYDLRVKIEVTFEQSSLSIQSARQGIIDIFKAIGSDLSFGGLAEYTDFESDTITKEQDEKTVSGATIIIRILYRTTKWAEN